VRVKQDGGETVLEAARDDRLPGSVVRVAAAHPSTAGLGGMFDAVVLEKA
jgi:NADH-quinone oxidoreductase subunit G